MPNNSCQSVRVELRALATTKPSMETTNVRSAVDREHGPDRPDPSHLPASEAQTRLHETQIPKQVSTRIGRTAEEDAPQSKLLSSVADRIDRIIRSAESLFREHQDPADGHALRVNDIVDSMRTDWNRARDGILAYVDESSTRGERTVEWIQGWRELTYRTQFDEIVQYAMCAFACQWRCPQRCIVNYSFASRASGTRAVRWIKLAKPPSRHPSTPRTVAPRATKRTARLPNRRSAPPSEERTDHAYTPVVGSAVKTELGGNTRHGEVVGATEHRGTELVEVAWGRDRKVSSHMPSELGSGFQTGDTVQDVPKSNSRTSLGTGTVMYTETLAGEEQVHVKFHESGEIRPVPFHRLRRVAGVKESFVNPKASRENDAERLRLKCLAHALESWNEVSGALGRLPFDPHPHQINIVHRIMTSDQTNWLIADDVGLGKTIEVGLLLAAKKQRHKLNRVLVVCPAALTTQWREEMKNRFDEDYRVYGHDFNVKQASDWKFYDKVVVSIDKAKSPTHRTNFRDAGPWDIVVFDEAHHLSKRESATTTQRYRLAETLRETTDEFIFLTGTPHQGDTEQFVNLLSLLRPDLRHRLTKVDTDPSVVAEVVLKNEKAAVTDHEGNFTFQGQATRLIKAEVSREMEGFQEALERYLKHGYKASESGGSRERAIGFVMTTYRKLASSSIAAIKKSLEQRRQRLLAAETFRPKNDDILEEFEDAFEDGDDGRDDLDDVADSVAARRMGANQFFDNESDQLHTLIEAASAAQAADRKLRYFLEDIADGVHRNGEKLLIFTEYLATQEYIVEALRDRFKGSGVAQINGSMDLESKLINIQDFNERSRFMVSTEAGGEGFNLHEECHIMVNYDIPWNPRRLVQRAGRLYRIGQAERVEVYNLLVEDSFDNRSLAMMLDRVHAMADQMSEVTGHTSERLRTEILGDLMEQLDIAKTLARNTDMNIRRSEEEVNRALEFAESAKKQQEFLFSQVEGFDRLAGEPVHALSQDDVLSFLEGTLDIQRINVRRRTHGGTVLEIELPDKLVGRFSEFANRRIVRITPYRDRSRALDDVAQMDFESPFFKRLIDDAMSSEFGGEYASIRGDHDGAFSLFKLRWNNDQGQPQWEALYPVYWHNAANATDRPDVQWFPEFLRNVNLASPADEPPNSNKRREIMASMHAQADRELSERRSNLRYPGGIVPLAAADIIADR